MKKIVEITNAQIIYIESNEAKGVILKNCNENYLEYKVKNGERINPEDKIIVGQRKATDSESVIELFTRPFTRFNFESKEEYNAISEKISKQGWSLLDWS